MENKTDEEIFFKNLIENQEWEHLAEAFARQDIVWHAKEWEQFVTAIREQRDKEWLAIMPEVDPMGKIEPENALKNDFYFGSMNAATVIKADAQGFNRCRSQILSSAKKLTSAQA